MIRPALALTLLGCSFSAELPGEGLLCPDQHCPEGLRCVDGVCRAGDPNDGPAGDGAGPSDGPPRLDALGGDGGGGGDGALGDGPPAIDAACPSLGFSDDFADGVAGAWATPYAGYALNVDETGGALVITNDYPWVPPDGGATSSAAGWRSPAFDLRGRRVLVRVPTAPSGQGVVANLWLADSDASGTWPLVRKDVAGITFATGDGTSSTVAYDGAQHAWWGFREAGGTLYVETSSDGAAWTTRRTRAAPAFLASTRLYLFGYTDRFASAADTLRYDDLNRPPGCP